MKEHASFGLSLSAVLCALHYLSTCICIVDGAGATDSFVHGVTSSIRTQNVREARLYDVCLHIKHSRLQQTPVPYGVIHSSV